MFPVIHNFAFPKKKRDPKISRKTWLQFSSVGRRSSNSEEVFRRRVAVVSSVAVVARVAVVASVAAVDSATKLL